MMEGLGLFPREQRPGYVRFRSFRQQSAYSNRRGRAVCMLVSFHRTASLQIQVRVLSYNCYETGE